MTQERTQPPHLFIVDDDQELCELLRLRFEAKHFVVETAHTVENAVAALGRVQFDAMLLDLRLTDGDGMTVLARAREVAPDMSVVVLTAHGSVETAVEAMRSGAFGFLLKPFAEHELIQQVEHAVENAALKREVAGLRKVVTGEEKERHLAGASPPICAVRDTIVRIADTDATVLLQGESGTGKELAARMLHEQSRKTGPFVAVNCAALAPSLLESTLFGHVKGAFTGAVGDREGLFGAARKGTLFLDEVAEASLEVQAKLLRVLEEHMFSKVGSHVEEETDARIVAATNRDLRQEVSEKRFREDLFFRLHVVPITMPPLRDRVGDILPLAEIFLARSAARHRRRAPTLTPDAVTALTGYTWPGNVRELSNTIEAAVLLATNGTIEPEHLPGIAGSSEVKDETSELGSQLATLIAAFTSGEGAPPIMRNARDTFEREYLCAILRRTGGNVSLAAKLSGRNRTDLYDLFRRHGIQASTFKT